MVVLGGDGDESTEALWLDLQQLDTQQQNKMARVSGPGVCALARARHLVLRCWFRAALCPCAYMMPTHTADCAAAVRRDAL